PFGSSKMKTASLGSNGSSPQTTHHGFPVATTKLKVVTFQDWRPARRRFNHPKSNGSLENRLSENLGSQCTALSEQRLSRLPTILKNGASALIHCEAQTVLNVLTAESIEVRLALIDPPYNRRTKFHHYNDSTCRKQWLATLSANCSRLR